MKEVQPTHTLAQELHNAIERFGRQKYGPVLTEKQRQNLRSEFEQEVGIDRWRIAVLHRLQHQSH